MGPWLPGPLSDADLGTPEAAAEFDSDVSIAFLALLEALTPEERTAFILHDIKDDDYSDIAEALGKSQVACRQMVHRARQHVTERRRRFSVDEATRRAMLRRFIDTVNAGSPCHGGAAGRRCHDDLGWRWRCGGRCTVLSAWPGFGTQRHGVQNRRKHIAYASASCSKGRSASLY
jgi:hypothetical protein